MVALGRCGAGVARLRRGAVRSRALSAMPLLRRLEAHGAQDGVVSANGELLTHGELLERASGVDASLRARLGLPAGLGGARVGVLCAPGGEFVSSMLGVWRAGGCLVPLCVSHPHAELQYVAEDCGVSAVVADAANWAAAAALSRPVLSPGEAALAGGARPAAASVEPCHAAKLIYTSGTTGRPKGVVTRHSALEAQMADQRAAWGWVGEDRALNVLPLHHVHGLVNMTLVPLSAGACVEFCDAKPARLWQRFRLAGAGPPVSVFSAVPTVYARLVAEYDAMAPRAQAQSAQALRELRLMMSGSAALPSALSERWLTLSGHRLLERLGQTETGMTLSNPLEPPEARHVGCVGTPLPSVQVRLVDAASEAEIDPLSGEPGELRFKGPGVFCEYWGKPELTAKEFDVQGWFKSGDVACYDTQRSSFRVLGRASADIIKSAGYKLSALEIEAELLNHPDVAELAVLGVPDAQFGEKVACVLRPKSGASAFDLDKFKLWAAERLAKYKLPTIYRLLQEDIPKNAMGKVAKKQLRELYFPK
jgi:malonyl-CoA/methylmalonyl-CoA synthetase